MKKKNYITKYCENFPLQGPHEDPKEYAKRFQDYLNEKDSKLTEKTKE